MFFDQVTKTLGTFGTLSGKQIEYEAIVAMASLLKNIEDPTSVSSASQNPRSGNPETNDNTS